MKFIRSFLLFIVISIIPLVLMYLMLGGAVRTFFMLSYLVIFLLVFKFSDKFILLFLNAREIIEADNSFLFQTFKSNCYRSYVKLPNIYLYSGARYNAFVLDNGKDWSVVIDRRLIENSEEQQLVALIDYLVKIKLSKANWLKTKGMGLSVVILKCNYWLIRNLLFLKKRSRLYRVLCFISLMFVKPLLEFMSFFVQSGRAIECSDDLKPIYFISNNSSRLESFSEFLTMHLVEKTSNKSLILEYLESFDIFKRCKFSESQ